jgi:LPPG:FO 2-phospho-L-lactate transferase
VDVDDVRITALCGGLGGARFALALQAAGAAARATLVTNVADDWTVDGLLVCPDTDAVLYALQGRYDEQRGWGILGDSFDGTGTSDAPWFSLGEQDRRHHQQRTSLLAQGLTLAEATARMSRDAGLSTSVVPATNSARGTIVTTENGTCAFQEWLVRDHAQPAVSDVGWPEGSDEPAPGVLRAIREADVVVLTSSSPVASLEPTVTLRGVRDELRARRDSGLANVLVSPVVSSPPGLERDRRRHHARAALLAARGVAHDPIAVSGLFTDFLTHLVLDPADHRLVDDVDPPLGAVVAPILAQDAVSRRRLVEACVGTVGP